jgi:hypothetical protein
MAGARIRYPVAAPRFARGESRADRGDEIELGSLFRVECTVSVGTWISGKWLWISVKWLQSIDARYLAFLTDQLLDYVRSTSLAPSARAAL